MAFPDHVVADEYIESAWGNAVVDTLTLHQTSIDTTTVRRFPSTAVRDSAYPASVAGAGAVCAVGGQIFVSDGTTWILQAPQSAVDAANANTTNVANSAQAQINTLTTNTRRMGCQVTGPGGSTGTGALATLQFTAEVEDTDNLYSPGAPQTVQIPFSGIWAVSINVILATAYNGGGSVDLLMNGGVPHVIASSFNTGSAAGSIVKRVGGGTTFGARFLNNSGVTVSWTGTTLDVWRISA
jgi:hypothetical protein